MMTEQAKVPAIRFAGFTDPWEQRKLGEIASFSKGSGYSKADIRESGIPLFLYGRMYTQYETRVDSVDTFAAPRPGTLYSKGTEIVVPASGESAEDIARASAITREGIALGGDLNVVYPQRMVTPLFLAYGLSHGSSQKLLAQKAQGKTVVHIHASDLKGLGIAFPDVTEQQAIGTFFSSLDDLITLHQRKYDKLVIFKKTMLEKMFPKDGESVPEIRFAGFTDPWEQRKLVEVATFGGGHTPPMADPDNYEDGYVLWVTSQDVKSNYLDRTTTQITEKGAKELTLYPAGSLVMVTRSGILRHTLPVAELRKPSTVNQDIRVILPQGECCGEWLLQFFISHNKELLLEFGKTGTTVESVDFGKIKDMLLYMPSTVEQQQIGDFFAKLDSLITLHQRKLELLRNIKKSLLDKMFV
ncbi:restriction endonuclease subunit S [Bifidobacterium bifidum]|nr:restriction endonuclease subunit S [Bifidobacterium bifidum]MDB1233931.1 restriction endonuclease subunit S [Bifidobacterium bifidum]MDB1237151.1 restriction endonuclease subunit S [Bifidobacterium bifidum]